MDGAVKAVVIAAAISALMTSQPAPSFGTDVQIVMATSGGTGQTPPEPPPADGAASADDGLFIVGGSQASDGSQTPSQGTSDSASATSSTSTVGEPAGHWVRSTGCHAFGAAGCLENVSCPDGSQPALWNYFLNDGGGSGGTYTQCPDDPEPTAATAVTPTVDIPGEVLAAFKKIGLPASTITVQPPGGETLVNFKTLLSTDAERHQINVHLARVNLDVVLEVWPSGFIWHHGDGTSQESTTPGIAWAPGADVDGEGFITHVYTSALKQAPVSVDTTWSAQFKLAGAPTWRPVDGTVTIAGGPVALSVREATPELVAEPR